MISTSKIKGFFIEKGFRILKALQHGAKTADECSPFGLDSNPINDSVAIFCQTETSSEPVIIGYIQKNRIAEPGEMRLYSVDEQGNQKNYIWLKKDGNIEVGGNADNLVRYSKLDLGLQNEATLINTELGKIAAVLNSLAPGSYIPTPVIINISQSKCDKVKTS